MVACNTCNIYKIFATNVTDGEKSSLNRDLNPRPLAYRASAITTELMRHNILTDSQPGDTKKHQKFAFCKKGNHHPDMFYFFPKNIYY